MNADAPMLPETIVKAMVSQTLTYFLVGVIGGSRLRSMAQRQLGMSLPNRSFLHIAGHIMILFGILVWAPYLYLKVVLGQPVEVMQYLPFHLTGVLGGVFLHLLRYVIEGRGQRK